TPPVEIAIAAPAASGRALGFPAATSPASGSVPGASAARSAKPSIAERGNDVFREHAAGSVGDRDALRLERLHPLEHARERLVDREQRHYAARGVRRSAGTGVGATGRPTFGTSAGSGGPAFAVVVVVVVVEGGAT